MWGFAAMLATIYASAPAWIGNAGTAVFWYVLVVRARVLPAWPLDGGARLGGQRIIGDSRTVVGSVFMLASATGVGYLQQRPLFGFALGAFALSGTLINSFVKRRLGIPPGQSFFMDHLDYSLAVIAGLYVFRLVPEGFNAIYLVLWVLMLQFSLNRIGASLGIRSASVHAKTR